MIFTRSHASAHQSSNVVVAQLHCICQLHLYLLLRLANAASTYTVFLSLSLSRVFSLSLSLSLFLSLSLDVFLSRTLHTHTHTDAANSSARRCCFAAGNGDAGLTDDYAASIASQRGAWTDNRWNDVGY